MIQTSPKMLRTPKAKAAVAAAFPKGHSVPAWVRGSSLSTFKTPLD